MEGGGFLSEAEKQTMVSTFLEITSAHTSESATQFLQATGWKLEEAIQLYYVQMESGGASSSPYIPPQDNEALPSDQNLGVAENEAGIENVVDNDGSEVRAPLPVKRDVLYDTSILHRGSRLGVSPHEPRATVPFRNFDEELKRPGVWGAVPGSTSAAQPSRENLASMYRPPFALMFQGPFEKAKEAANRHDRWLIVNVQSTREFSSHTLNRDTWANEAVAQTISSNFIFWQVFDDVEEGSKIITYYKLDSVPVTLVIDPITGQKMRLWRGMIQPESLLEDLLQFLDASPKDHHLSLSQKRPKESSHSSPPKIQDETNEEDDEMKLACALSMEGSGDGVLKDSGADKEVPQKEKHDYPPLPEEPKSGGSSVCRVGVRLPDGRRVQRNFFRSDPIQLLWSFCAANCGNEKPFRLTHAIPGAVKDLDYDSKLTFEESGVANSMISVTWL
ncbi:putative UBX domain-containing protein 2/7 [Helianthus annuus]|uniref:UBX domain-containing protein 2/7 n=1 Tax=Helianthus annuus TaxID=4232 RepID=A0A251T4C3_HELAN|nr:plant UBX domain-containing protein 7 [Helianthus annuus]KAF5777513.1 putative UBX domain-containing protein 2/7 [Helianthus annuus]KAJ0489030.1 putative UBX domain, UBA-like superfamily, Ubiquitin-like domain superfamily [Helianthus annuus]KAJ0492722.1 putative UBX domain, UBA-like superfamily, Ubiquitin-like domain superfamily [Helianthus annuus]KAJ0504918.1 putative UBX domain, UBA-like superfamily, Ubiquitin-like domain superfamily [Helianthus annuus]KAJ0862324.1 putative UBX domain-con